MATRPAWTHLLLDQPALLWVTFFRGPSPSSQSLTFQFLRAPVTKHNELGRGSEQQKSIVSQFWTLEVQSCPGPPSLQDL